jgi:hypothetical protein
MDIDNVNRSKKKDKSKVICYNYGKTGYYKNECRIKKKNWISVSENKIKSVNMVKGMYNIVSELKPVRFRLPSSESEKEIKVITKDETRKHDRNVE